MILAITGATGFVGSHVVDRALAAGHAVRALARRPQPVRAGVTWIEGTLDDDTALQSLVEGSTAVIHVAGVVNAPTRDGFATGNVAGTAAMLAAAGSRRFVHVSSLSAREPALSIYGWSKREAETLVEASAADWVIVRPSGVYGPGDMDMRDMFRLARHGLGLLPPAGQVSLVAADDLARLLLALAEGGPSHVTYEVDDGEAVSHAALAQAIGGAVGRKVLPVHLPAPLLRAAAWLDCRLRGAGARLTQDRVGYMVHPDWVARAALRPHASLWTPAIALADGLAETARWYRANGLL